MVTDLTPGQLVGADIKASPTLRERDEAGYRHRPLRHGRNHIADRHVLPISWRGTTNFFGFIMLIETLQVVLSIDTLRPSADFGVLGALFACQVSVGTEAPAIGYFGDQVAVWIEEVHVVDLLDCSSGEFRIVLDQVLQPCFGADFLVAQYRLVPRPVSTGPHRMDARNPAHVSGHDAAGGEQETRQRHDAAETRPRGIRWIAPQRVVVTNAVSVMTDVVACCFVAPWFERILDPHVLTGP